MSSNPFRQFFLLGLFALHFSFFIAQNTCNCEETKLSFSKNYISQQQLIFRGKTTGVEAGEDYNKAHFSVTQLFKGNCPKEVTVYFDKRSECNLKIAPGEDWLIYANFKQIQKPYVEYCSRSRKNVINTNKNVDLQYIKSDLTVDAECDLLAQQLGRQSLEKQNEADNRHSNIIPGFWQRIVLILLSIVGFVVIYFLLNKFLKR